MSESKNQSTLRRGDILRVTAIDPFHRSADGLAVVTAVSDDGTRAEVFFRSLGRTRWCDVHRETLAFGYSGRVTFTVEAPSP